MSLVLLSSCWGGQLAYAPVKLRAVNAQARTSLVQHLLCWRQAANRVRCLVGCHWLRAHWLVLPRSAGELSDQRPAGGDCPARGAGPTTCGRSPRSCSRASHSPMTSPASVRASRISPWDVKRHACKAGGGSCPLPAAAGLTATSCAVNTVVGSPVLGSRLGSSLKCLVPLHRSAHRLRGVLPLMRASIFPPRVGVAAAILFADGELGPGDRSRRAAGRCVGRVGGSFWRWRDGGGRRFSHRGGLRSLRGQHGLGVRPLGRAARWCLAVGIGDGGG